MSACAIRPDAGACSAFAPIYLDEAAIAALAPHRPARERIATHNATWERLCTR
ncbi:MAG: hypothetical protein ACT4P2_12550 [Pseudomonadota bacterium]